MSPRNKLVIYTTLFHVALLITVALLDGYLIGRVLYHTGLDQWVRYSIMIFMVFGYLMLFKVIEWTLTLSTKMIDNASLRSLQGRYDAANPTRHDARAGG